MIQYDYRQIEYQKAWNEKHYYNKKEEQDVTHNIRLSENLSYVFRMFLASMLFIAFILSMSA